MRAVDIAFSVPTILLGLVLAVVIGPSFRTVIVIVAFSCGRATRGWCGARC